MNKFKVGDWVRHPKYGIGRVGSTFEDGSLGVRFIKKEGYIFLNIESEEDGVEEEIETLKKLTPNFDDFDSLFTEVEETRQFKVGDKVKTNRIIYKDEFTVKKNAVFTVKEVHKENEKVEHPYIDAIYENDFLNVYARLYFEDIELFEED